MATKQYELMVILDPATAEEEQNALLDQIDEVVTKYGGTPDSRDVWGRRRLAYEINRRKDGWYALVYFTCETTGKVLGEVDRFCKFSDGVLRHLITTAVIGKTRGEKPKEVPGEDRPAYWTGGRISRSSSFERRPRTDGPGYGASAAVAEAPADATPETSAEAQSAPAEPVAEAGTENSES